VGEIRPDIRASDADRDRVVDDLREHAAAGRLATEELEERIDRVFEARTHGELTRVVADLPKLKDPRRAEARRAIARRAFREHLRTYLMVMALLVVIWALTGMGYFWPVWPALGWGIGVASHAACTPRRRRAPARNAVARV
jgi:hypothetical protein